MIRRVRAALDPFLLALVAVLVLASLLPPRGGFVPVAEAAADAGIVLLFLLHGAKLSREAIVRGLTAWRLHLAVLATTFVMFPLLGLGFASVPGMAGPLGTGLLFLALLPSTVQSSVAFISIARGNVAAGVCAAAFSNLLGIVLTPLLAFMLMGGTGIAFSLGVAGKLAGQMLLPFAIGHLLRPWIGGLVARRKRLVSILDRGSILLIVYTAFGAAAVEGLWGQVDLDDLAVVAACCLALLALALVFTRAFGRVLGLSREDAIVLRFAGTVKSLATGVPIAGVLFPPAEIGAILLPVMLYHQFQLTACAIIARRLARQVADAVPVGAGVRPG
jgi:sodium/bile acid cotransporter 7